MPTEKRTLSSTIVFFDGICHLCNRFVDEAILRDKNQSLQFAPLQGETAKQLLPAEKRQQLETVLVLHNQQIYEKSEAVLLVFSLLPGYSWTQVLRHLPRKIRDGIYDFVASHRLQWFGSRDSCRLPSENERNRLLP